MSGTTHEPITIVTQPNIEGNTIIDNEQLRRTIIQEEIGPAYRSEMHSELIWRRKWNKIASVFFTLTFIIMACGTFVSFFVPIFPSVEYLPYIVSGIGLLSMVNDRFAHFANKKSSESTRIINMLANSIGINDEMPDISIQITEPNVAGLRNLISAG